MFYGHYSSAGKEIPFSVSDRLRRFMSREDCLFHTLESGNLTVGVVTSSRLPYTQGDVIDKDNQNGLITVLSGVIYNTPELCSAFGIEEEVMSPRLLTILFKKLGPLFVDR